MKRARDILSDTDVTPSGNGRTTSSLEPDTDELNSQDFVCRDPENPDLPCPLCDGVGVYTLAVPIDDPRFGKFQRCPNHPVETDLDMQERLRRFGNLDSYRDKTFDNFHTSSPRNTYSDSAVRSLEYAKSVGEGFASDPRGWIVYEGPYGCGKTHLAVAIANVRLTHFGDRVLFITAPDLLDFLRTSFSRKAETTYNESFEQVRNVEFLVLDDLGVENPSGWAKEKLFQLLNYRHIKRLPTVVTTNTSLDELDPRISSRMMQRDVVKLIPINAPDYRLIARSRSKLQDMRHSNLHLYERLRFERFDTSSLLEEESKSLARALTLTKTWSKRPEGWIFLMGPSGSGKTHLAASIAFDLYERGQDMKFITVPDLLDYLRLAFDPSSNSRIDRRFDEIINVPILILDDLSMASATAWAKEKLFQLLDYRYLTRMPTVITSSETMQNTDPRLATRLMDRRVCFPFALEVRSYVKRMKTQT